MKTCLCICITLCVLSASLPIPQGSKIITTINTKYNYDNSCIPGETQETVGATDKPGLKVNFADILEQSKGILEQADIRREKPFGLSGFYLGDSPSFSDFNNLFNKRPTVPRNKQPSSEDVGDFSSLTGELWDNFRNIFLLSSKPRHEGYAEIFGPVYGGGQGCGLCHLFPGTLQDGDYVTVELAGRPVDLTSLEDSEVGGEM